MSGSESFLTFGGSTPKFLINWLLRQNQEKNYFADIQGFYVESGGRNNNINITYVLEYVPE